MKSKNLILALVAIVFAVGSAFSFKDVTTTAWVKVRYSTQPLGTYSCVNTGVSCNDTGTTNSCKVTILDKSQDALARSSSSCPAPSLFHSVAQGVAGDYDDGQLIVEVKND